jgi:TRAP-type uncharacterized transport system fused permease subunit
VFAGGSAEIILGMGIVDTISYALLAALAVNFLHLFRAKPVRPKAQKTQLDC